MGIFHFADKYYEGHDDDYDPFYHEPTLEEKYKQLKTENDGLKEYIELLEGAIEWYKKNLKPEEEWVDVKTCYIND